jgi:hypothetical protein
VPIAPKASCKHTDENHCALANRFIAAMNMAMRDGYCSDFVASAATAAAAAFAAFNLTEGYQGQPPPRAEDAAVEAFRGRFRDALAAR